MSSLDAEGVDVCLYGPEGKHWHDLGMKATDRPEWVRYVYLERLRACGNDDCCRQSFGKACRDALSEVFRHLSQEFVGHELEHLVGQDREAVDQIFTLPEGEAVDAFLSLCESIPKGQTYRWVYLEWFCYSRLYQAAVFAVQNYELFHRFVCIFHWLDGEDERLPDLAFLRDRYHILSYYRADVLLASSSTKLFRFGFKHSDILAPKTFSKTYLTYFLAKDFVLGKAEYWLDMVDRGLCPEADNETLRWWGGRRETRMLEMLHVYPAIAAASGALALCEKNAHFDSFLSCLLLAALVFPLALALSWGIIEAAKAAIFSQSPQAFFSCLDALESKQSGRLAVVAAPALVLCAAPYMIWPFSLICGLSALVMLTVVVKQRILWYVCAFFPAFFLLEDAFSLPFSNEVFFRSVIPFIATMVLMDRFILAPRFLSMSLERAYAPVMYAVLVSGFGLMQSYMLAKLFLWAYA